MGAWGPGLLENDVALDMLGTFDDLILSGASVESAVAAVMAESKDALGDEDDRPDLILALAWLTSERRVTPDWLASEARQIIADEVTLMRWEESDALETRRIFEQTLLDILDGRRQHPGRT